ncbi:MAG: hypothetical protein HZB39_20365 [Planctomycetes bacterium]|nr:hypothetical protein [Planctomycetota bacterium]
MRSTGLALRAALAALGMVATTAAQEHVPGLVMTVSPAAPRDGSLAADARVVRALALYVERGEAPSAFVAPGMFEAVFSGFVEMPARDDWTFSITGFGSVTLEIDGQVVLNGRGRGDAPLNGESVRLRKGRRALVLRYGSPLSGAGELRVSWASKKVPLETIPPTALFHDPAQAGLAEGRLRREGRMLLATLRCTACHALPADFDAATGLPELAMRGPSLRGLGSRLAVPWLAEWIEAPHRKRAGARMPKTLHGADAHARAGDIAVWLGTLREDAPATRYGDAARGAQRFAELGCIACHAIDAADETAWVSLSDAPSKFEDGALARFLLAPAAHEPSIRMPDLRASEEEAADLDALLRSRFPRRMSAEFAGGVAGDASRGAVAFASSGCANCHEAGVASTLAAPGFEALAGKPDQGCLATDAVARRSAPEYAIDDAQRAALRAALAMGVGALVRDNREEHASRQLVERRCDACHALDGKTSLWDAREDRLAVLALPEPPQVEGQVRVAQLRPSLTWAGEKLQRDWCEAFLRGDLPSPRRWLLARMPRLGADLATTFAHGLAAQHGLGMGPVQREPVDPAQVAIGRSLIGSQGGFGCVTCHAVAGVAPAALFEVQGIDFQDVAARLRPDWFRSWMLDPVRYEPAAKMPRFATEDLRTALEPMGGDARAQFEAIWHWLRGADELRAVRREPR